jgi:hypothetical protein
MFEQNNLCIYILIIVLLRNSKWQEGDEVPTCHNNIRECMKNWSEWIDACRCARLDPLQGVGAENTETGSVDNGHGRK